MDKQKVREVINKLRGKHCELFDDGCKDSAGCCDACALIEDIEQELGL